MLTTTGILFSPFSITDISSTEIWKAKTPVSGDHIRVDRGAYFHHGIYIANDEVIHFSSEDDDNILGTTNEIIKTDVNAFHRGDRIQVKIYTAKERHNLYPVEAIVHWARACIGEDGYCLFSNNCEHFASFCTLGTHRSHQVEKFISRSIGGGMGWLGDIGRAIFGGGSSTSRDSSTTTYEPDKVRVAEIEASVKVKLAGMEHERIKLYAETQMELIRFNAEMEAELIAANARGEHARQQSLTILLREVITIAEQRLEIIKHCSLDAFKQVEGFYKELTMEVRNEDADFIEERLKKLQKILREYEPCSPEYERYSKEIDRYCTRHDNFISDSIRSLRDRQKMVIDSFLSDKEQINTHINLLVEKRIRLALCFSQSQPRLSAASGSNSSIKQAWEHGFEIKTTIEPILCLR